MATSRRDLGRKLLEIKADLEERKAQRATLVGEHRSLMRQLKNEFDLVDLEQAQEHLKTEIESLHKLEDQIVAQLEELERLIEGNDDREER